MERRRTSSSLEAYFLPCFWVNSVKLGAAALQDRRAEFVDRRREVSIGQVSQGYSLTSGPQREASVKQGRLAHKLLPQPAHGSQDDSRRGGREGKDCDGLHFAGWWLEKQVSTKAGGLDGGIKVKCLWFCFDMRGRRPDASVNESPEKVRFADGHSIRGLVA
jgi:hypothetical protein